MSFRSHAVATIVTPAVLALLVVIYRGNIVFAATALPIAAFLVTIVAFNVHRVRLLRQTLEKLDELLRLLESPRDHLSRSESRRIHREFAEMRALLLREESLKKGAEALRQSE